MADQVTTPEETTESPVEEQVAEAVVEETPAEEVPVVEPVEEPVVEEKPTDMVTEAMEQNKALKKQLEDLKNSNSNVFEENEILKAELEQQEKLVNIAKENQELNAQLTTIKKNSLVEGLVSSGRLNNDLREWADGMDLEQLQTFAKNAPKMKTVVEQENKVEDGKNVFKTNTIVPGIVG